jgi:hypothetical protein
MSWFGIIFGLVMGSVIAVIVFWQSASSRSKIDSNSPDKDRSSNETEKD